MIVEQTLANLRKLKLRSMAAVYDQQLGAPSAQALSFDDRLGVMVDAELNAKNDRKLQRLIKEASLPEVVLFEDLSFSNSNGLDAALMHSLATGDWVRRGLNVVLSGPTGSGKTWTISSLGTQSCRQGFSVLYLSAGDLYDLLKRAEADGSWPKVKRRLIGYSVLIIDDFGMAPITAEHGHVLLDIIDKRHRSGSLVIASQFPVSKWHSFFPDPTMADAVLDRIVHQAHEIQLKGESLRKLQGKNRPLRRS